MFIALISTILITFILIMLVTIYTPSTLVECDREYIPIEEAE